MDKFSYRIPPEPVSDYIQMEIVLVHGVASHIDYHTASEYWYAVWEWLDIRYPGMFAAGEFPNDWYSDAKHEKDMEILSCIHTWQRVRISHGESGSA